VFRAVAGMLDWPAGLVWRPGAVVCPVTRWLPIPGERAGGVKDQADVSAVKRWAKLPMMMEAVASLSIGALVIARAINILK